MSKLTGIEIVCPGRWVSNRVAVVIALRLTSPRVPVAARSGSALYWHICAVVSDGKLNTVKLAWRPDEQALMGLIPRYRARELSYPEVGATQAERLPAGYHHVIHRVIIGSDELAFARASNALTAWEMHRRAGLVVAASDHQAAVGVTTVMSFGTRLAGVVIPCRVVWTSDESDRRGFAYGTLTGHPESGEEAFMIERVDGTVTLSIRAFSKPGDPLVRMGSRLSRLLQSRMTTRYGRSLADLVRAP